MVADITQVKVGWFSWGFVRLVGLQVDACTCARAIALARARVVPASMSDFDPPYVSLLSRTTARSTKTRAHGGRNEVSAPVSASGSQLDSDASNDTDGETDGDNEQVARCARNRSDTGRSDDALSKAPQTPDDIPMRPSAKPLISSPTQPPNSSPRSMSPTLYVPSLEEEQACEASQKVPPLEELTVGPLPRAEVEKAAHPPSTEAASSKDAGPKEAVAPSSPLPAQEVAAPSTTASLPPAAAALPPEPRPQLQICPDNLKLPLRWDQMLYHEDPVTSERKFDRKRSPIDLPNPDLELSGYVLEDNRNKISALSKRKGLRGVAGARVPRPAGGATAPYFQRYQSSEGWKTRRTRRALIFRTTVRLRRRTNVDRVVAEHEHPPASPTRRENGLPPACITRPERMECE
jgi:hypothetical protein